MQVNAVNHSAQQAAGPRAALHLSSRPAQWAARPAAAAPARASRCQLRVAALFGTKSSESAAQPAQAGAPAQDEFYEVYLDKPLGLRFGRGTKDGGAYILKSDPRLGNTSDAITPGDKIVAVSASFGGDVWEAENYGQTVYAIRTRNGQVYIKLKKNFGDMSALEPEEMTEEEKRFMAERNGGNYGMGTKEMQARNYQARKEAERERRALFDAALQKFRAGQIEQALIDFENVLGLEPKNYLGDDFSRTTQIYRVTQYNIACCYATLNQVEAGLESLESALAAGFEDFAKVRSDPNLANLRADKAAFNSVINKYDEPVINEEAINAIKSFFGGFGKK